MFHSKLFCSYIAPVIAATVLLYNGLDGVEHELLQPKDVNKIMQQIFDQHVDQKEISGAILKKSLNIYIDQFDPKRMYLTEVDVQPYLQLNDAQIATMLSQYKNLQFSEYQSLNNVIQAAIQRSRTIRAQMIRENASQLFQASTNLPVSEFEEWRDPDLKRKFAANDVQLKERIRQEIITFIAGERKRYGDAVLLSHQAQTFQIFEKKLKEHEDQYLFTLENGQPMSEAEKQNAFAMHILKSIANSLDSHTTVLNSSEAYDMRLRLEKKVEGVGIVLKQSNDGSFIVSQMVEGGAALKSAQVKLGDKIIEIDGNSTLKMALDQVMQLLQGKNGTKVSLLLQRNVNNANQTFNVRLESESIAVNDDRVQVNYERFEDGIIGKIKLDTFYQSDSGVTSENDIRNAINKLNKQGKLKALILDFRENSGGFLSQAVKVAGLFITNGVVVVSKYFNGEEHIYRDMDGKKAYDGPLIILTSKVTASAAEIVAEALQDYGVALIVGDVHTYGKGTIQSQTVTDNQGAAYFKVTVGKYYTVSGKTPQIQGVKADVIVPSQFVHDSIGEEYLEYSLKPDMIAASFDDSLSDVPANLKSWYLHYYAPTVQRQKNLWRAMIPNLKKNSEYRIANNRDYQVFLKGAAANTPLSRRAHVEDLQLSEAVNVAKDMVNLQNKQGGGESLLQAPQSQTASVPAGAR